MSNQPCLSAAIHAYFGSQPCETHDAPTASPVAGPRRFDEGRTQRRFRSRLSTAMAALGIALFSLPQTALAESDLGVRARNAAVEDLASTAVGLAMGASEANPLGLLMVAAKVGMLEYAKTLPVDQKAEWQSSASAMWTGAAANNWCVIAALATGGGFAPLCPVVGVMVGVNDWNETAPQRSIAIVEARNAERLASPQNRVAQESDFWQVCASERRHNPALQCKWTPPA